MISHIDNNIFINMRTDGTRKIDEITLYYIARNIINTVTKKFVFHLSILSLFITYEYCSIRAQTVFFQFNIYYSFD